jgi:hypothetical protein
MPTAVVCASLGGLARTVLQNFFTALFGDVGGSAEAVQLQIQK